MHSSQLRQKFTWLIAFIWTVSSCKNYCWCSTLFELRVILVKKRCTVFMFQPTISILVTYFWSAQVTWLDRTCLFAKALVCPSQFFSSFFPVIFIYSDKYALHCFDVKHHLIAEIVVSVGTTMPQVLSIQETEPNQLNRIRSTRSWEMTLHFVISCSRVLVCVSTGVGSDRLYSLLGGKQNLCGHISPERDCLYGSLSFFRNVTQQLKWSWPMLTVVKFRRGRIFLTHWFMRACPKSLVRPVWVGFFLAVWFKLDLNP